VLYLQSQGLLGMLNSLSARSRKLYLNVAGGTVFKGINIVFSLLLIRVSVNYFGAEEYGIWLSLLAFFTWFSAIGVGITNNLRNTITQLFNEKKKQALKKLISQGYQRLTVAYVFAILLVLLCSSFSSPSSWFSLDETKYSFRLLFSISLVLYFLHFIFFFLDAILLATHHARAPYAIVAIQNGALLLGIYLFSFFEVEPSLHLLCIWYTATPLAVWVGASLVSYSTFLSELIPDKEALKKVSSNWKQVPRLDFFIIQLCVLVLYATDNFILLNYFNGEEVTRYNISFRYFNLLSVVFNLVLLPFWASFAEAAHKKDLEWIKKSIRKLILFWLGIVGVAALMILLASFVYRFWIGEEMYIPLRLTLFMAVATLLTAWYNVFAYFLNSIAKVRLQLRLMLLAAAANIPLSIYLLGHFESSGVIMATAISVLPLVIGLPIQYRKIIKQII
jgi:O-antigen/teichoic acid export membrane protein